MTFKRSPVRKLFYRLGFKQAPKWDDDKLREMAQQLPKLMPLEDIPKKYHELYAQLAVYSETGAFIVWESIALDK